MSEYQATSEFKERNRPKKKHKKKNYLFRILIILCFIGGLCFLISSSLFDVKEVYVENNDYYTDDEIIAMSDAKTGVNIFWGVNKSDIAGRLEKNPYFADVKVKKKFPDKLVLDVSERRQTAAIPYGEDYIVIDAEGIVLRRTDVEPKLTLLKGLTISKMTVGERIDAEESIALENTLAMLDAMSDGDIFFKKIYMSKVLIKAYIYDALVCKGTPKLMLKSIKSGDLQKVVNKLFQNKIKRGTISLGSDNYVSFSPDVD